MARVGPAGQGKIRLAGILSSWFIPASSLPVVGPEGGADRSMGLAGQVRSEVLAERERGDSGGARLGGASPISAARHHIPLPLTISSSIVALTKPIGEHTAS